MQSFFEGRKGRKESYGLTQAEQCTLAREYRKYYPTSITPTHELRTGCGKGLIMDLDDRR